MSVRAGRDRVRRSGREHASDWARRLAADDDRELLLELSSSNELTQAEAGYGSTVDETDFVLDTEEESTPPETDQEQP